MSMFNNQYGDELLLYFCGTDIDLHNILIRLNKYYYNIINTKDNYKVWISLLNYNEKYHKNLTKYKNYLFMHACRIGNIVICNYLINKFDDIDIHEYSECAFRWCCIIMLPIHTK